MICPACRGERKLDHEDGGYVDCKTCGGTGLRPPPFTAEDTKVFPLPPVANYMDEIPVRMTMDDWISVAAALTALHRHAPGASPRAGVLAEQIQEQLPDYVRGQRGPGVPE